MTIIRRLAAVCAAILALTCVKPASVIHAADTSQFQIISSITEYGRVIDSLIVSLPDTVEENSVTPAMFTVHAVNSTASAVTFDSDRTITDVYPCDAYGTRQTSGSYLCIELLHGFDPAANERLDGSYISNLASFDYTLKQNQNIRTSSGKIPADTVYECAGVVYNDRNLKAGTVPVSLDEEVYGGSALSSLDFDLRINSYEPEGEGTHPLVVWINYDYVEEYKDEAWTSDEAKEVFGDPYVLVPSCPASLTALAAGWDYRPVYKAYASLVLQAIEQYIAANPGIDTHRIYVGGYSFSSGVTLECILQSEDRYFAAAFPMSGGFASVTEEETEALVNENIWFITANGDIGYSGNTADYNALVAAGSTSVKQTVNQYVIGDNGTVYNGHWNWVMALNNDIYDSDGNDLWTWLASCTNEEARTDGESEAYIPQKEVIQKEIPFNAIAHIYDYGEVIDEIRLSFDEPVINASAGMFKVNALHTSGERTVFEGERKILEAYVSDEAGNEKENGTFITLKLQSGYQVTSYTDDTYSIVAGGIRMNGSSTVDVTDFEYTVEAAQPVECENSFADAASSYTYEGLIHADAVYENNTASVTLDQSMDPDGKLSAYDFDVRYFSYEPEEDGQKHPLIVWVNYDAKDEYEDIAWASDEAKEIFSDPYVLVPSCPVQLVSLASGWDYRPVYKAYASLVLQVIDQYIKDNAGIDTSRIYIGGYSFSSGVTLECILQSEDRYFAAAFPMSGGFAALTDEETEALKNESIWFITCEGDMGYAGNVADYNILKEAGAEDVKQTVSETIWGDDGTQYNPHWNWIMALNNDIIDEEGTDLWTWLAAHTNKKTELFNDVTDPAKYYYNAVYWAKDLGITKGYSEDNTFRPEAGCTREAVVTFLWRLAGQPEPSSAASPFKDIKKGKYYYKAVLWAAENGITKGYKDGTFRPDDTCLREHVATFLYRYAGSPAISITKNPFNDIKTSDYYYKAVLWANENGIAKGYSSGPNKGGFGPKLICLREHVVTFLYRYAK